MLSLVDNAPFGSFAKVNWLSSPSTSLLGVNRSLAQMPTSSVLSACKASLTKNSDGHFSRLIVVREHV